MDSRNPSVVYAAMWQAQRVPWKLTSGGPGSGLYKTTNGGGRWTKISSNRGFATGTLGKIGVSVAQSDPRVVYATVRLSTAASSARATAAQRGSGRTPR